MITMLKSWKHGVELDGVQYASIDDAIRAYKPQNGCWSVRLLPPAAKQHTEDGRREISGVTAEQSEQEHQQYKITVKAYMTRPTEPGSSFDFMQKFNENRPMPLRTMIGWTDKETRGMYHMHLHGIGLAEVNCMRCGRPLTNPISRHYGIGPECMQKLGIVADINAVDEIREKLTEVTWQGWVIKSAIVASEEVK